ncbi:hypothetical protein B0X71_03245 [Planococcus lenghuensis]|uniref:Alpha/beta hydrolase fold-3 domain-containing protein n=2 Tax=Planococcus lenghuensis TaxID=2213202 RepID=A0A1Q2L3I2_9BACL|nr:hypothetical protein B0X71_03245 [Planococcus lenghuensis]
MRLTGVKMVLSDPKKFDKFIKTKRLEGDKPYSIPKIVRLKNPVKRMEYDDMIVYKLRPSETTGEQTSDRKQVLHLHGGGYILQPHKRHWHFLDKLVRRTGWEITMPIYPKIPHHSYEESFPKVLSLYKDMLKETAPEDIVLLGESSGGGFVLALAQLLKKEGLPQPGRLILISPWLDATVSDPDIAVFDKKDPLLAQHGLKGLGELWAGSDDPKNELASPINGDLQGLAPITLFTGTHDILLPDARNLKEKAEKLGVDIAYHEYPNMTHCFPLYPIPEADKALEQLISTVES